MYPFKSRIIFSITLGFYILFGCRTNAKSFVITDFSPCKVDEHGQIERVEKFSVTDKEIAVCGCMTSCNPLFPSMTVWADSYWYYNNQYIGRNFVHVDPNLNFVSTLKPITDTFQAGSYRVEIDIPTKETMNGVMTFTVESP